MGRDIAKRSRTFRGAIRGASHMPESTLGPAYIEGLLGIDLEKTSIEDHLDPLMPLSEAAAALGMVPDKLKERLVSGEGSSWAHPLRLRAAST